MATESTKITEATDSNPESEREETLGPVRTREPSLDKTTDKEGADIAPADEADDLRSAPADTALAGGFAAGAAAVISAGLGICSLTGTALSDMLRSRMELIGQIKASAGGGGGGGDQIKVLYSAPWHTAALLNGTFALIAIVIGGVLLAVHSRQADTRSWVRAVALGGVALGAIGLLVAGGMYLDLFASTPALPTSRGTG